MQAGAQLTRLRLGSSTYESQTWSAFGYNLAYLEGIHLVRRSETYIVQDEPVIEGVLK